MPRTLQLSALLLAFVVGCSQGQSDADRAAVYLAAKSQAASVKAKIEDIKKVVADIQTLEISYETTGKDDPGIDKELAKLEASKKSAHSQLENLERILAETMQLVRDNSPTK